MNKHRQDEIYEDLQNLRLNLESFDGSKTMGYVTHEMEMEASKIRTQINQLEEEMNQQKGARNGRA